MALFTRKDWLKKHGDRYRDIPWSNYVLLGRERHLLDLDRQSTPGFPFHYSEDHADDAVWFMSQMVLPEGDAFGKFWELPDWEELDIVRPLFGWQCDDIDARRFITAYVEVARQNTKSTLSAGIGGYMFMGDREWGGKCYNSATKEDQAKIVWDYTRKMIENSPVLGGEMKPFAKSLYNETLGSILKPLGRDSKTQDGFSVHFGGIDEYHAHKNNEMYRVLTSGRKARRQPLILITTTAGTDLSCPCKGESDFAKALLKRKKFSERYYAFVATVDYIDKLTDNKELTEEEKKQLEDGWKDETEQIKANPNWGISIRPDIFRADFEQVTQDPLKENEFKTKSCNIWCGQATRWISMERWSRCDAAIDWSQMRGWRCFAGLDLGISEDISSLVLAFMDPEDQGDAENGVLPKVYLLSRHFVPEIGLQKRAERDGIQYPEWAESGRDVCGRWMNWITPTPGETTRYDYIRRELNELSTVFEINRVTSDPAHAHQLITQLADDGFEIQPHGQGFTAMNDPCTSFNNLIKDGRLRHGGDPVLSWMAGNVAAIQDGFERIRIAKDVSGDRVDGIVAGCMAVGQLMISPEPVSPYETGRLMVLGA